MAQDMTAMARSAKSVEELLEMAKENGVILTEERAKEVFTRFQSEGEISDNELEAVSGGCDNGNCPNCGANDVRSVATNCYVCNKCHMKFIDD